MVEIITVVTKHLEWMREVCTMLRKPLSICNDIQKHLDYYKKFYGQLSEVQDLADRVQKLSDLSKHVEHLMAQQNQHLEPLKQEGKPYTFIAPITSCFSVIFSFISLYIIMYLCILIDNNPKSSFLVFIYIFKYLYLHVLLNLVERLKKAQQNKPVASSKGNKYLFDSC